MKRITKLVAALVLAASVVPAAMPSTTRAATLVYHAIPRGSNVVDASGLIGAGDPDGSFVVGIDVDTVESEVCSSSGRLRNLGAPTEAHLRRGPAGTNGPIVVTLSLPPPEGAIGTCVPVPAEVIDAIVVDPAAFYVDLHTDEYPDGAARGQLDLSMCTLVGWGPDMDQQGEGSGDLYVWEGQRVQLRGRYWDGADVKFSLDREGVVAASGTETASGWAHDWFFTFDYDAAGAWTLRASVPGVGQCEDVLEITVADAGEGPVAEPSTEPLPNTAAVTGNAPGASAVVGSGMLLVALAAIMGRRFRGLSAPR